MLAGALNRNGVILTLGLFVAPHMLAAQSDFAAMNSMSLAILAAKEVAVGLVIGYGLAIPFWMIDAIGTLIDNQRGASIMESINFMTEEQDSPTGNLLNQALIAIVFTTGIFLLFMKGLYLSYETWPVASFWPSFDKGIANFVISQFALLCTSFVVLSFPVIIAMFLSEMGLAFINRFAPQLNVFILSLPIKSAMGIGIMVLYTGVMITFTTDFFQDIDRLFHTVYGSPK